LSAPGSLSGVRVIAIEQAVAAPLCTRHMADLGADVIKIERPGTGDFARDYDDFVLGYSSHFIWLNRGKRSVVLDLKTAEGTHALCQMLRSADVLVSNLAPGAFDRILSDAELVAINPRLVRCFLSGYGPTGPWAHRKAYDLLIQGEAGTIAATGTPTQPAKPGVSMADLAGGTYALAAINAALFDRERTGTGRRIELALFDVLLEWMSPLLLAQRHTGGAPEPAGLRHASIAPYGPYASKDGDQVLIAVQNPGQWRRLCAHVLRDASLASDPDTASNAGRLRNRARVEDAVQQATALLPTQLLLSLLEEADVPYAHLNQLSDVLDHPQAHSTGRWSEATLPDGRTATVVTSPFATDAEPTGERRVPRLGQHTSEVLQEAGLDPDDVQALVDVSNVAQPVAIGRA